MLASSIAKDIGAPEKGVAAVIQLLDDGATVPFVARYRKEATGALDEVQIRTIAERVEYLRQLEARRAFVLETIGSQGELTDDLRARIAACTTKAELEDLYLPYKRKKKTKASIAREAGYEPVALEILAQRSDSNPSRFPAEALEGAHHIVVEMVAEHPDVRSFVREEIAERGLLSAKRVKAKTKGRTKFEDYYDFAEPIMKVPSHRYLAVARGEAEGVLRVKVAIDDDRAVSFAKRVMGLVPGAPFAPALRTAIDEAIHKRVVPSLGKEARGFAAERAEREAIEVFADNLANLLLAAPYGARPVLAIDPGVRTGCKCVALDASGEVLEHTTIYALRSDKDRPKAAEAIVKLVAKHRPDVIAVGNGTGGRETEQIARLAMKVAKMTVPVVSVSEAGASVYSASEIARAELPGLDVTIRGAVSIGRRLQDPLAELVKIEPKAIGVGQYQHDVDQGHLQRKLAEVVESCVNRVGVELSTASPALLAYIAGIGPKLAQAIVAYRAKAGFSARSDLLRVKGLGKKAFEQCAGFVRLANGAHPLDRSAVHPERYALVERIASDLGVELMSLVGDASLAKRIDVDRYVGSDVGALTLDDIVKELERPGRDPRASFEAAKFRDDVNALEDLQDGMVLEGVVTNVTAFGAFVDVGVHQDGLVHISELADRFVKDPSEVVKVGARVKVVVLEVDLDRRRIALSRKRVPG
jgi:uncharacterized protein